MPAKRFIHVHVLVVNLHGTHLRELRHGLAVGAHRREHRVLPVPGVELAVPATELDASCQALDVVLPGAGQGLVEVVDVEHKVALRRAENAEVGYVSVTAELDVYVCGRRVAEVRRHGQRRPAEVREGRGGHALVTHGQQVLQTRLLLGANERHRVLTVGGRVPLGVAGAGYQLAQGLAVGLAFLGGAAFLRSAENLCVGPAVLQTQLDAALHYAH